MSAYHPLPEFLEIARALQITGRRLGDALVPRSLRNREKKSSCEPKVTGGLTESLMPEVRVEEFQ